MNNNENNDIERAKMPIYKQAFIFFSFSAEL